MSSYLRIRVLRYVVVVASVVLGLLFAPSLAQAAPVPTFTVSPSTSVYAGTMVTFDASASVAQPDATYSWDFGNGDTFSNMDALIAEEPYGTAGTYTVTLTISDSTGTASTSTTITVSWVPPSAAFSGGNVAVEPGDSVTFTDQSIPGNGTLGSFVWDFGDGATARGLSVTHAYAQDGLYLVTETVTDSNGLSSQASEKVTVDTPPVAAFVTPRRFLVGKAVTFDASSSRPTGPVGLSDYTWDFGDGTLPQTGPDTPTPTGWDYGNNPLATHAYRSPGIYEVTLTVTDAAGLDAAQTESITVQRYIAVADARADFAYELGHLSPLANAWLNSRTPRPNPSPVCPKALITASYSGGKASCMAEFAYKGTWYLVSGTVSPRQDENAASSSSPTSTASISYSHHWTRVWRQSTNRCTRGIPGRLSSNDGTCYGLLIEQFFHYGGHYTFHFEKHVYIMGTGSGDWPHWNTLTCSWAHSTYQCTNFFGDGFRWMPYAR